MIALFALTACVDVEERPDTPEGNFAALWQTIDERYCFLDYKREAYGLDWQEVRVRYAARIDSRMSAGQLFEVLAAMLAELRDGHVNLYASHDQGRYWAWKDDYPQNSADTLYRRYLGTDYKIAGAIRYRILHDNIGYMRYPSFGSGAGEGNISEALYALMLCRGLIIDIRDNGGGQLDYAQRLAAHFFDGTRTVGYMAHKRSKAHGDFSPPEPQRLSASAGVRWYKPVCVLTNRSVYSAANEFVKYMKGLPNVRIVGDTTGGGAGMPFNASLPNGWVVRFSACPMYDADMHPTEFGIEPDVRVSLSAGSLTSGRDDIIEAARQLIIHGME